VSKVVCRHRVRGLIGKRAPPIIPDSSISVRVRLCLH
jgi:hypothetical protein